MTQLKYQQIKEWLQEEALKPRSQKRMPTVREIRRRFGVSQAPVSRALQELESIGIISRRQGSGITAVASDRKQVMGPKKTSNGTIFFAYPMYQSELQRKMLHIFEQSAIQENIDLRHYGIIQNDTLNNLLQATTSCDNLRGMIITTGADRLPQDIITRLGDLKVPVALTDNQFQYELPRNVFSLLPDMYNRGYIMAKYLIDKGHTRISIIRNEPLDDVYKQFQKGVKDAVKKFEKDIRCFFFATSIRSWEDAAEASQKVITQNLDTICKEKITAMGFYSTAGAFAGIQTLTEAGIKVPDEISIIGGSEYWYTKYSNPALTCVTCDYFQMHCDSFAIASEDGIDFPQEKQYKAKIIERKSVIEL